MAAGLLVFTVHCTHRRNSIITVVIGSYLKAVRVIAEIWNSILCFYGGS